MQLINIDRHFCKVCIIIDTKYHLSFLQVTSLMMMSTPFVQSIRKHFKSIQGLNDQIDHTSDAKHVQLSIGSGVNTDVNDAA